MTWDKWKKQALELRAAHERAEVAFYEFLLAGEEQMRDVWSTAAPTWADFLDSEGIADARKLNDYRKARQTVSADVSAKIGIHGAIEAAKASDDKRDRVIEALLAEAENKHGAPVSAERAQQVRRSLDPKEAVPIALAWKDRYRVLEAEYKKVMARVEQLERENAELRGARDVPREAAEATTETPEKRAAARRARIASGGAR